MIWNTEAVLEDIENAMEEPVNYFQQEGLEIEAYNLDVDPSRGSGESLETAFENLDLSFVGVVRFRSEEFPDLDIEFLYEPSENQGYFAVGNIQDDEDARETAEEYFKDVGGLVDYGLEAEFS